MTHQEPPSRAVARARARARIFDPVAPVLRRAGAVSLASGVLWPVQAAALAWAVDGWVSGAWAERTIWAALGFLLAAALRAALEHRAGALLFEAADRTIARERAALLARAARSPGPDGSAAMAALMVQKLPMLQPWITRYHVAMLRASVLPLLLLALAFWHSWAVGLVLLVAGPLIPVFMALVGMAAEDASRRQLDEIGGMNAMLMERLSALPDIRLLGAGERAAGDFAARAEALRQRTMAVLRIAFLSSTVLELFAAIGVAMVAVFVGFSLLGELNFGTWGQPMTLASGLFLLLIAPEYFQPLRDLAAAWHDRAAGFSVVAELDALDAAPGARLLGDGAAARPLPGPLSVRLTEAVADLPGGLRLPELRLRAGEAVALTGPSGAGKTTALQVIAGLVPLAEGQVEVCGVPLSAGNADAWRARLAVLPQRPHFPDRRLADWLDPRGTGDDPWPALGLAGAAHVVEALPEGLETRLGETGSGVSGGEARRLMIARAVMAGGDLLLADEPTADLDADTARAVIEALARLRAEGRTLLVATHDPALIAAMDRAVEVGA
ncbi:ABC transporter ATP-binding protein/permease [Halovulum sp. GXIMD14794]